ncbi:manganese efflux pump MntP family protein [Clostridium tagluense]|uniref:manganese efflux pump MntP n=1 Tax=Clostridium tagluense TaxID=360422 RepID=UPI001C0B10A8|nr:manganese efflux pump MntP family protein [Clostridium tagluense]MBU3130333.1 manganese efflux pump MntP family protein [Clostridium tagluense]MCB2313901.1 manganese efflux pump MntP family protein [Clostridium tagluense]MCB2318730.1 manganese efflux pump MntP family protein [Clostridium tagluense]MCB2323473.1 manganese efflux pump MntP family protein [Clostridium tagluense]MCB2328462.1 manganese efflux pump MntP family protein [Clostridium tagluense]
MELYPLFTIALALSLDAFGVALCIGLNNQTKLVNKIGFIISFGLFQFLFSYIGAYVGFLFNTYVATLPIIIGGMIISLVGVLMIVEGFKNEGKCPLLKPKMYLILGMSVSIDAMVVGFTVLNNITKVVLFKDTLFIGGITLIMSTLAFIISRYLKKIEVVGKYADYIGGTILIIFGLKMMFF